MFNVSLKLWTEGFVIHLFHLWTPIGYWKLNGVYISYVAPSAPLCKPWMLVHNIEQMFSHKSINFNKKLVAVREKTATLSHSIKRERHAGPQIFIVVRPQRAPSQASEVVVNSLCPSVNLPLFYLSTCRRTSSPISHRALSFEPRRVTFKWNVESDARLLLEFVADLRDNSRLCWKTETWG